MTLIESRGLSKRYGRVVALDQVDLALPEGAIHGLLGRNGAGKTTLLRLIAGQLHRSDGVLRVRGRDPFNDEAVCSEVCLVSDSTRYPDLLTVEHVVRAARLVLPHWDDDFARSLVEAFELPLGRKVKKLSRGMRSAVGLVVGLASRAPLTCFDEPYLGLDASARQLFHQQLLADYLDHRRTIILSTHLIDEVADLLEHVVVLNRGRVVLDEPADRLRGRAVTVTGPVERVERFVGHHSQLGRQDSAGFTRITVGAGVGPAQRAEAAAAGLRIEPLSLQDLVIHAGGDWPSAPLLDLTDTDDPSDQERETA